MNPSIKFSGVRNFLLGTLLIFSVIANVFSGWKVGLLIFLGSLSVLLIIFSFRFLPRRKLPFVFKLYFAFTIMNLASSLYSANRTFSFDIIFKMMTICTLMILIYNYCLSTNRLNILLSCFLISSFSIAFYNVAFYVPSVFRELPFGGPNPIGLLMYLSILLCIFLFINIGVKKLLFSLPLYIYVLLLTESQKSILSLFIIFSLYLLLVLVFLNVRVFLKYFFLGLFCLLFSVYLFSNSDNLVNSYNRTYATISSIISGTKVDGAAGGVDGEGLRADLKRQGWEYFSRSPFLGYGTNNFRSLYIRDYNFNTYTHYTPLEVVLGVGFLGFFVYYSMYFFILKRLYLSLIRYKDPIYAFLISIVFASIIIGFYMQTYADISLHLLLIFVVCFDRLYRERKFLKYEKTL